LAFRGWWAINRALQAAFQAAVALDRTLKSLRRFPKLIRAYSSKVTQAF
jgi:hypothetical protein